MKYPSLSCLPPDVKQPSFTGAGVRTGSGSIVLYFPVLLVGLEFDSPSVTTIIIVQPFKPSFTLGSILHPRLIVWEGRSTILYLVGRKDHPNKIPDLCSGLRRRGFRWVGG